LHDTTTKVLGQNVNEILTYFVHFLLFVHLWMIIELCDDNNYNFLITMDNISYKLFQINLHGAHGISINFPHKYNFVSMHKSKLTILILDIYHHNTIIFTNLVKIFFYIYFCGS